jgi:hypothetical protein
MNLQNINTNTRIFAAGLCGTAVLAFTALDVQVAQAQDSGEEPEVDQMQNQPDAQDEDMDRTSEQQANNSLDLDNLTFEAEVVKTLGQNRNALIVSKNDSEFLLPSSVATLVGDQQNQDQDENWTSSNDNAMENDETVMDNNDEDLAVNDMNDDMDNQMPENQNMDTAQDNQLESTENSSLEQTFSKGDQVEVRLNASNAELVALENNVLTVRTDDSIMQLPAELISKNSSDKINLSVKINGEKQQMTLSDAIDQNRELTLSQDWPNKLPANADAGVLVASEPERLILATVGDDNIELVQVPQSMQAGEAVALSEENGTIDVEPMDESQKTVSFNETKLQGNLVSRNNDLLILETNQQQMILPANLDLQANNENDAIEEGSEVTAILPAGEAEMIEQDDELAIIRLEQGVAHLPLDLLNQDMDDNQNSSMEQSQ